MAPPTKSSSEDRSVQTVLNAFDTLFNRRDYVAAERFWSPRYIQHSAHIPPGRDGLFDLVKALPATLRYENHIAAATGDFVILHGRFSGHGLPAAWVVADIVRMERARGALGRHPGRSHTGAIAQRSPDVRRYIPGVNTKRAHERNRQRDVRPSPPDVPSRMF